MSTNSKKFSMNNHHAYHHQSILLKHGAEKTKYDVDFKTIPYSSAATTVPKANAPATTATGTSKTILITNNYNAQGLKTTTTHNKTVNTADNLDRHDHGHGSVHNNNNNMNSNSSITIMTSPVGASTAPNSNAPVVLDRINICINNHFNDPMPRATTSTASLESDLKPVPHQVKGEETTLTSNHATEADSTSNHGKVAGCGAGKIVTFNVNEDVLVQQVDGCFYLGTVVKIDRDKCLIQFDDNTAKWSLFCELTKLSTGAETESAPLCVVCKKNDVADTVEVCEKCGRGYHKKCTDGDYEKNGIWSCKRCTAQNATARASRLQRADIRRLCSGVEFGETIRLVTDLSQLPYDINALHWDPYHRVNQEQIYCYCGKNGEWYLQMLQCWRCQQWFHEKCVQCLSAPLYYGDRFFLFVCMACNEGAEFVRRLELAWADVIHLMIFNLTVHTSSKYHDLTKVIIPYIEDNLSVLQVPKESLDMSMERRRELICSIIKSDKARFKCGREIKKNSNLFGLRSRIPPQAPTILLPTNGSKITEEYLKSYLPYEIRFLAESVPIKYDQNIFYRMSGKAYESCNSDDEEPVFDAHLEYGQKMFEEDEIPTKFVIDKNKGVGFTSFEKPTIDEEPYVRNLFPPELPVVAQAAEISANVGLNESNGSMPHLTMDLSFDSDKSHELGGDDSSSLVLKEDTTSGKSAENSKDGFVDTTSFKAASETGGSRRRRMRQRSHSHTLSRVKRENSLDICDSSGDDDTSSRSTLDLIIPPPKNFRGTNNPFHNLTAKAKIATGLLKAEGKKGTNSSRKDTIFLQKQFDMLSALQGVSGGSGQHPNQLRIVRTVKRKLSAKDIVVGPNMEVKRRKVGSGRRSGGNCEFISTTVLNAATTYPPLRADYKDWLTRNTSTNGSGSGSSSTSGVSTPLENAPNIPPPPPSSISQRLTKTINGRRLRQRPEKNYSDTRRSSTGSAAVISNGVTISNVSLASTPLKNAVKDEPSLSDLQSSLQVYIDAGSRIASGEKFRVRGKRLSLDGRLTYLLEWEGGVSSLL